MMQMYGKLSTCCSPALLHGAQVGGTCTLAGVCCRQAPAMAVLVAAAQPQVQLQVQYMYAASSW
jgi:hypothetical protein